MSLLNTVKTDESIENEKDFAGGGGPFDSALYPMEVSMAYLEKKQSGALFLNLTLKSDEGREYKEGLCLASGDAKGNKNYYETANGDRKYLPGFNHANSLALLTVGKELSEVDTEEKTIAIYNFDQGKDVMTKAEVVTELLGQRVIAGIQKQIVDKQVKNEATGKYENTGQTRETNEIDKFFREKDQMTTAEIRAQAEEPAFYHTWDKKWTGQTRNKASAANDSNGGSAGAPAATGGGSTAKPTKSLFG